MKERRYPLSLFLIGFITNILFRFFWLFIPSTILLIVGIFVDWCLYVGLVLLVIDIIASFIEQMRIRQAMLSDSDNEQFRKFQDAVSKDGNVFGNIRNRVENTAEEYIDNEEMQKDNLVVDMCDTIYKKCEYGNDIEKLNEYERVFFVTQTLEQEVNNGGFSQFFYNSSGDFSNELVDAFTKIGALKTAEICKKALSVFNGKVPTERDEREELLDSLDCDNVLSECDDAFYNYEDDLEALNHEYLMKYREFFN
ncbi:MAG: DMP19 family protein [Acutalibacteraceae bacterium]